MDDKKTLFNFIFNKVSLALVVLLLSINAVSDTYLLGDVAPRGAPDGQLNAADSLILQRMVLGDIFPTSDELLIGDVAPLGAPDGALNGGDLVVQQRSVLGLVNPGTVNILPPAPTLYSGASPTTDNPYLITGKASPNTSVDIYVQGSLQQQIISDATDGTFLVNIYLSDGLNDIYAVENDGVDISPNSNTLQVQYDNVISRTQSGTITSDTVWTPGNTSQPYIISSTLTIDANVSLIVQSGTELKFESGTSLVVNGNLIIAGTASNRVIFTSNNMLQASKWKGIQVESGGNVTIDNAVIEYINSGNINFPNNGIYFLPSSGGSIKNTVIQFNDTGIRLDGATSPTIGANNIITKNSNGVYLFGSGGVNPAPIINGNNILDNSSYNILAANFTGGINAIVDVRSNYWGSTDINLIALNIRSSLAATTSYPTIDYGRYLNVNGELATNRETLAALVSVETVLTANTDYDILGNVDVPAGVTLTIPKGVTLYFPGNGKLNVNGGLDIQGTAVSPVLLMKRGANKWSGVTVSNTAVNVRLNYVQIENATTGVDVLGSDIVITNSLIQSCNTGIKISDANGSISSNIIQKNSTGIHLINASPVIQSNQVINNVTFGMYLYQQSSPLVNNSNIISGNTKAFSLNGGATAGIYPMPVVNNNQISSTSFNNVFTTSYLYTGAIPKIDFQNNWWNTTDVAAISKAITDINDNTGDFPLVDFTGFLAAAGGNSVPGSIFFGGNVSDSRPGGNGLAANTVYQVSGNITVPVGETLTIPEGVQLQFPKNAQFNVNGTLKINGTTTSRVVLTNQATDSWSGIRVSSTATDLYLNYVQIENAAPAVIITGSDGIISNSIIQNNTSGIKISDGNGLISNTIIKNNNTGIYLTNASPMIQGNQIINNTGSSGLNLIQQSSPTVSNNIITGNGNGFILSGNATIGNYPLPIVNNNQISNVTNVTASQYYYTGEVPIVDFQNNWWGSADISSIAAKIKDYIDNLTQRPVIDFSNALAMANGNTIPATYLLGGNRFDALPGGNGLVVGTTYLVLGDITVPAGETLTIPAGVQLRFLKGVWPSAPPKLSVYGALIVQGTVDLPVIFTSSADASAMRDWSGIIVQSGANVIIDYAIIEYANFGVQFLSGSSGAVSNSIFVDNSYGIYMVGLSNPVIDSNTMVNNQYGIYIVGSSGNPDPTITNNDIYASTVRNLQLSNVTSTVPLNISGNWWGTDDIPTIRATISGTNSDTLVLLDNISLTANNKAVPIGFTVSELYISPNISAGKKDTTTLSATLTASGNWLIEIINEAGQIVKTESGAGTLISRIWDGTDNASAPLPDGKYALVIIVDGIRTRKLTVVIDNTFPVATISSPLANTALASTNVMDITGTSSDANIEGYTIEVADSFTPIESDYILLTSAQLVNTSSLFSWLYNDINGLQEYGDKTIRLSVSDKAGNKSTFTVPVTLDYLAIRNVSLSSDIINTQNGDSVNISFTLGRPLTVALRIYNELENKFGPIIGTVTTGLVPGTKLVREKIVAFAAGDNVISWDGLDGNGNAVPQDAYRFELIATSGGESNSYSVIPAQTPYIGLTQNIDYANYAFYKNEYVTLTTTIPPLTILRLYLKATNSFTATENIAALNKVVDGGDHIFLIDGRNNEGKTVNSGSIISTGISKVFQKDSNSIFVKSLLAPVLQGTEIYPDIEIKSNPYRIKYSYDQVSMIAFTVSEDSYVSVDLMDKCFSNDANCSTDPAVASVLNIMDNELLVGDDGSGTAVHSFEWRGYDFEPVNADTNNMLTDEEGFYTFLIKAISVSTGLETTYRGSLLLYH